jgi:tRNA dimethylallyltransferase
MPHLIAIAGPTASGKTALSIRLAKVLGAEIISADARQFYRGMHIGTAKPTSAEMDGIPHHFIDILDPGEAYAAGQFEQDVLAFLQGYFERHDVAILVGGSGLYLNAVTDGFDQLPSTPQALREQFDQVAEHEGLEGLQRRLKEADPDYYDTVDLQNRQRVQRALEAITVTGKPFSELRKGNLDTRPFTVHKLLLWPDREALYQRINRRVDQMVKNGLFDEVKKLLPYRACNALQTVGYKEIFDYLDGTYSLDEAIDKVKQHTRNYAKRQYTWFRKQEDYVIWDVENEEEATRQLLERLNV